jgi:tRNA G18 (ribose-2'-O)-methylase SpoU
LIIEDPNDPRIAMYRGMRDPTIRSEFDSFIAEGPYILSQAVAQGFEIISALVDSRTSPPVLPVATTVFAATPAVIGLVSGLGVHRGVLAVVRRPPQRTVAAVVAAASRLLVLEGVENPVNVGLITRTAAAFGFDGLLVDPTSADPLYRRALTASRGAALRIPWARIGKLPDALHDCDGFTTVALTTADDAVDLTTLGLRHIARLALVLGTEGFGLTAETAAAATARAKIEITDQVDSLNVAAAAAVACWEARKVFKPSL